MTVKERAAACGWTLLAGGEGEDNQIDGCYIGDLLSWVMARAQSGNVWITAVSYTHLVQHMYSNMPPYTNVPPQQPGGSQAPNP